MKAKLFLSCLSVLVQLTLYSQVSVSGPVCVLPGMGYQYAVPGVRDSGTVIKVCVTGGKMLGSSNNCQDSLSSSVVTIIWDSVSTAGSISIISSKGNSSLSVSITRPLYAGTILDTLLSQSIDSFSLPQDLLCTAPSGGGCQPEYRFQWQKSGDNLQWADIPGAEGINFHFPAPLTSTTYYRRKLTEANSETVVYSDAALIIVLPSSARN
jgi:hypothetical protein